MRRVLTIFFLFASALATESGLLALANWQKNRYHQRLTEQAAFAARPPTTVTGHFLNYATVALTNQPNPLKPESELGWRILTPLQTASGTLIIDRGYMPPQLNPDGSPNFEFLALNAATQITPTVTGVLQPYPQRRGILRGPDTTTHPKLLAFLNPTLITSDTLGPAYLIARTPSAYGLTAVPPPLPAPTKHLSYALQWLGLAIAFPIMCALTLSKSRRARPR